MAPKRKHARIYWKESAQEISNLCRAFKAAKGAWARVAGKRLYVWRAAPYRGKVKVEDGLPGQVLAVTGGGVVVQKTPWGPCHLVARNWEPVAGGPAQKPALAASGKAAVMS